MMEYERLAWWILSWGFLLFGYWLGYRTGWRDRWKNDVHTVTAVENGGSTLTIECGGSGTLRPGDKIRFLQ